MATRTRISKWNSDRGFGFTEVDGRRVFVHCSVVSPRPARGTDLTGQQVVVDGVNWTEPKGPRALAVYTRQEWDRLEAERRKAAEAEARRKAEMPVEWTYSNKIGKRGRRPTCFVVTASGDVHRFTGNDIPGVVEVVSSSFTKKGKWSHYTWWCASPEGTKAVSWLQSWEEGLFWPQGTWEEAIAWFRSEAPQAKAEAVEAMIRRYFPEAAEKFDASRAAMAEFAATAAPVEWTAVAGPYAVVDLIVTPSGSVHVFAVEDIPGVVNVLREEYHKKGKWSTTTYRCMGPAGTTVVSVSKNDLGRYWPQTTWEEAIDWFRRQAPQAKAEAVEALIRERFPDEAQRLDAERARLAAGRQRLTLEFGYKVGCAPADPELAKWGIDGDIVPCEEIDSGKAARAPSQRTEVVFAPVRALEPGEFIAIRSWKSGGDGFDEVVYYDHNLSEVEGVAVEDLKQARANAALVASGGLEDRLRDLRQRLTAREAELKRLRRQAHGKPGFWARQNLDPVEEEVFDLQFEIHRLEELARKG